MLIVFCHFRDTGSHHFLAIISGSFLGGGLGDTNIIKMWLLHTILLISWGKGEVKEKPSQMAQMQMFSKTKKAWIDNGKTWRAFKFVSLEKHLL